MDSVNFSAIIVLMAIMLAMPAIAQDQDNSECFEQCSTKVTGLFTKGFSLLFARKNLMGIIV